MAKKKRIEKFKVTERMDGTEKIIDIVEPTMSEVVLKVNELIDYVCGKPKAAQKAAAKPAPKPKAAPKKKKK